jgi:hypothetical protein
VKTTLAAVGTALVLAVAPAGARASATINVNTTADVSLTQCTLRAAITAANNDAPAAGCVAGNGDDTINIGPTGTITLGSALPTITSSIGINGPGAAQLDVHRSSLAPFQIFRIGTGGLPEPIVSISGLTVSGGLLSGGTELGAGIYGNLAQLTLDGVRVTGNNAVAIDSAAAGSAVAEGGGMYFEDGELVVRRSSFVGNTVSATQTGTTGITSANASGAGIYAVLVQNESIERSTFSGNNATASTVSPSPGAYTIAKGGGIFGVDTVSLRLSTVSGNGVAAAAAGSAQESGGGVYSNAQLDLTSDTINSNSSPEGGANLTGVNGTIAPANTIVSDPRGGAPNCALSASGLVTSGHNLEDDAAGSCGFSSATDLRGVSPQLGPLQDNGGPTLTEALAPTSPALDKGSGSADASDQRDLVRPVDLASIANAAGGDGADIGAFELQSLQPPLQPPVKPTGQRAAALKKCKKKHKKNRDKKKLKKCKKKAKRLPA